MYSHPSEEILSSTPSPNNENIRRFVDLYSGCGGLSLGLTNAGWRGMFAIEKDRYAFETFKANLVDTNESSSSRFDWPDWLPIGPMTIEQLRSEYLEQLQAMSGQVDLVTGGPPCQGFSMSGQRNSSDPRNRQFKNYVEIIKTLRPKMLLIENVLGMTYAFNGNGKRPVKFADQLIKAVRKAGYTSYTAVIRASDFGVAQSRPRFFLVGLRSDLVDPCVGDPFKLMRNNRKSFLAAKGLIDGEEITVGEAIGDLTSSLGTEPSTDTPGFAQTKYAGPLTSYQRLLAKGGPKDGPNSRRLANHRKDTVKRFKKLQKTGDPGKRIDRNILESMGLKKHTIWYLSPNLPAPTLTTLPDDMLHYDEPRIPTVREMARLQSFPDWFEFRGKYTTGGTMRTKECPRFTQVGNAVAPFVAESIGETLLEFIDSFDAR
jgi:DNA (cytosine-5)-methyltransferase 1